MEQHLKTTIAVLPSPIILSINNPQNGTVIFGEFEGKFLQAVLDALGTDYNAVVPKDKQYGSLLPNGSWTGMVGMVQRGEADLAFTFLTVTEARMKVVNFSTVYAIDACTFVTVMPEIFKSPFSFLRPFDLITWVAIFVTLGLMAILFGKLHERKFTLFKTFFKLFANFTRQASMPEDRTVKYKVLLVAWLLFATVITFSYSATLLSFLVQPIKDNMIRTFRELSTAVQRGTHKAVFYNYSLSFLLNSEDVDLKELGEIAQRNKWFVETSKRASYSYIKSRSVQITNRNAGRLIYGNHDDLYMAEDTLYLSPMAFAYGKSFCCLSELNSILLRLSGAGLHEKILRDYSLKYFLKSSKAAESSTSDSLSMSDLLGSFMLLGVGMALSIATFFGEIFLEYFIPHQNRLRIWRPLASMCLGPRRFNFTTYFAIGRHSYGRSKSFACAALLSLFKGMSASSISLSFTCKKSQLKGS